MNPLPHSSFVGLGSNGESARHTHQPIKRLWMREGDPRGDDDMAARVVSRNVQRGGVIVEGRRHLPILP